MSLLSRRPGIPTMLPIPRSTTVARTEEASTLIDIKDEEMSEIDAILARFTVAGGWSPTILLQAHNQIDTILSVVS